MKKEEQKRDFKILEQNNNMLVSQQLKLCKCLANLNLLLDYNNMYFKDEVIYTSDEFINIDNKIYELIELLGEKCKWVLNLVQKK